MYAPVATRFHTYRVKLDRTSTAYSKFILAMPEMVEWVEAAQREPDEIDELDMEF
jgi:glutathione S-transferase